MPLNLDVVCAERQLPQLHSQAKVVQVIGEILPFVLAKYGIEFQPTVRAEVPQKPKRPCVPIQPRLKNLVGLGEIRSAAGVNKLPR